MTELERIEKVHRGEPLTLAEASEGVLPMARRLVTVLEALADPQKEMPALPYRNVRTVIRVMANSIIQIMDGEMEEETPDLAEMMEAMDCICRWLPEIGRVCRFSQLNRPVDRLREAIRQWDEAQRIDYRIPREIYIDHGGEN